MIELTRLNGETFTFNAIYIEQLQSNPDTTITTTKGRKFVVRDSEEDVKRKIKKFYQEIGLFRVLGPTGEGD
ncbi:hypothetical protein EQV77_04110 [Halobacillus fulvus]|nr:hypothetical protein EQV77_04110 [Halobacillus fulvus]